MQQPKMLLAECAKAVASTADAATLLVLPPALNDAWEAPSALNRRGEFNCIG